MDKQLLLALQKRNTARLEALKAKLEGEGLSAEELAAIETEITELDDELERVAQQLANLEDVSEEQPEENLEDPEQDPEESSEQEPNEEAKSDQTQARSRAMAAITAALSTKNAASTKKKEAQMRSAFANFVVGNISEVQARSLGLVTGQGSVLVPESIAAEVISYAQEENLLRKYGTPHKTKGYAKFPVLVKKAVANATKTERNVDMPETDVEFDEIMLDPTEFDAIATVSKKLLLMSDVNVEEIVVEELKKAYVEKETRYMFNGNDAGAINPGALAKKAVKYYETTAVAMGTEEWSQRLLSQLVKMKNQVPTAVLKKSIWIVNRAALTALEDMTDTAGRPLLHVDATDGVSYKLLGHKLDVTDAADVADVNTPVFYFGDFSSFHYQNVIGVMQITRLVEKYAAQNKIGFQIYNLLDGQLIYSPLEPTVYIYEVGAIKPVGG